MTDILNTGKSALFAFKRALATTSHNISNVNTEGYSRQRVDLVSVADGSKGGLSVGAGVRVASIQRMGDQFASARVQSAVSEHSQQEVHHSMASRMDNIVAADSMSVSPALSDFFSALHDANSDPSSSASREVLIDSADKLASRFRALHEQLNDAQTEVNDRTREAINSVDEYAQSISALNQQLVGLRGTGNSQASSDLLDQRDKLVTDLSALISVDTVEQENGALNVYMGKGIALVVNSGAQRVSTVRDDTYPDRLNIQIGEGNTAQIVQTELQGGVVGGLNEFVNETLHPTMQELGHIALGIADKLNETHKLGFDINGEPGGNLFEISNPQVYTSSNNAGSANLFASINDVSALEATDYLVRFDGANFTATRNSDGTETTGTIPLSVDGMRFNVTGVPVAGDTFVVSATGRAAADMEAIVTNPEKLALSGQLTTSSSIQNLGEARISTATVTDPEAISLTVPVEITFTDDNTYDVVETNSGTVLSSANTYISGDTISVNGWEVTINGQARSGDVHQIGPNTTGRGNNANGLSLAETQNELAIGGSLTFNDAYGSLVARIGSKTSSALSRTNALEVLKNSAIDRQQSVQGVSLDEEAVDLTRYQQAYQASAQVISVADTLFQSILGAIR